MKIIKTGTIPVIKKRIECGRCHTIFEVNKDDKEYRATSQIGVMHDGLPSYNVSCPVCGHIEYFEFDGED